MTKAQYEKWSSPFRKRKAGRKLLNSLDRSITALVFCSYPIFLGYLMFKKQLLDLVFCILIPAISFLLVSFFRKIYFAPRPYELLEIEPLLEKETKGKSFPSRHIFSIFMIGMTFFYQVRLLGIVVLSLGVVLSYVRVVGGVHFPKDAAAGAVLGIFCGLFYFILQ